MKLKKTVTKNINLKKPEDKDFEVHFKNADLFIVLKGSMKIQLGNFVKKENVPNFNDEKDFGTLSNCNFKTIFLEKNDILLVPKGQLHKPGLIASNKTCDLMLIKMEEE